MKTIMCILLLYSLSTCRAEETEKKYFIDAFTEENIPLLNFNFDDLQLQINKLSLLTTGFALADDASTIYASQVITNPLNNFSSLTQEEWNYESDREKLSIVASHPLANRMFPTGYKLIFDGTAKIGFNTTNPQYSIDIETGSINIWSTHSGTGQYLRYVNNIFTIDTAGDRLTYSAGDLALDSDDPTFNPASLTIEGAVIKSQGGSVLLTDNLQPIGTKRLGAALGLGTVAWEELVSNKVTVQDRLYFGQFYSGGATDPYENIGVMSAFGTALTPNGISLKTRNNNYGYGYMQISSTGSVLGNQYGEWNITASGIQSSGTVVMSSYTASGTAYHTGELSVSSGTHISLNGIGGDKYIKYDNASGEIQIHNGNKLVWRIK